MRARSGRSLEKKISASRLGRAPFANDICLEDALLLVERDTKRVTYATSSIGQSPSHLLPRRPRIEG